MSIAPGTPRLGIIPADDWKLFRLVVDADGRPTNSLEYAASWIPAWARVEFDYQSTIEAWLALIRKAEREAKPAAAPMAVVAAEGIARSKAASRKKTRQQAAGEFLAATFPDGITPGVSYKAIARMMAIEISADTVARADKARRAQPQKPQEQAARDLPDHAAR